MEKKRNSGYRGVKSAYFSHHISSGYIIRGEIWLERNGRLYVDTKRVTLLKLIEKFGSLAAAARSMKLGYNAAWLWIMAMNRLSPSPLVKRRCGGTNGGYSTLTEEGHKVIDEFNKLNGRLEETINHVTNLEPPMELQPCRQTSIHDMEVTDDRPLKTVISR